MNKKLCKSRTDKKLCGVCAGIAKYLEIDPTIIRLLWAGISLLALLIGFVGYIVAALVMPFEEV